MSTARTIDDAIVVTLEFHNARVIELHDRIDALEMQITELRRELRRLMHERRTTIGGIETKITEVRRLMHERRIRIDGIESRLARMDQRIDHIGNSISAIESCLATWMPFITVCMRACMPAHIV